MPYVRDFPHSKVGDCITFQNRRQSLFLAIANHFHHVSRWWGLCSVIRQLGRTITILPSPLYFIRMATTTMMLDVKIHTLGLYTEVQ
jgi:hypothetical protein